MLTKHAREDIWLLLYLKTPSYTHRADLQHSFLPFL
jgi:hypothetical protein